MNVVGRYSSTCRPGSVLASIRSPTTGPQLLQKLCQQNWLRTISLFQQHHWQLLLAPPRCDLPPSTAVDELWTDCELYSITLLDAEDLFILGDSVHRSGRSHAVRRLSMQATRSAASSLLHTDRHRLPVCIVMVCTLSPCLDSTLLTGSSWTGRRL